MRAFDSDLTGVKRRFADLVDIGQFNDMMASFYQATGIPHGLIDVDNNVLSGIGWQDICSKFHRVCEASCQGCFESDRYIAAHLHDGSFIGYRCANGLMDYATPIIIDGEHVATIFLGQLLHEPPDRAFFKKQAERFGIDEKTYMAALDLVPIIPEAQVKSTMAFYSKLAGMLAQGGHDRLRHLEALDEVVLLNRGLTSRVEERTRELSLSNLSLLEEVEEHKQVEGLLQREHDFVQALIDSMPGIYYLLDSSGRFVLWNKNLETVLGCSGSEILGKSALVYIQSGDGSLIQEKIARVFTAGSAVVEAHLLTKSGEAIPYYFTGVRVILNGQPYLTGVGVDITERVRSAEALREKAEAVERSNAELEQFAYVASHDLREPLRMISSYVALLEKRYRDKLDKDAREFIAFASDGAKRMDHLVLDLLEYSRVGRSARPKTPHDSRHAVDEALVNLALVIEETKTEIQAPWKMPVVLAHGDELIRLFQNLIGNAIKYRHPERTPCIQIETKRQNDEWVFSISDNGIGIEEKFLDRIFLIFQRLHSRKDYDGTGIGLAVCKKIVEQHGGHIWVTSAPGKGSTFSFALPVIREK
ncbi:MAG: PocR ligand-binding domain-containing protein [Alphaproteobacteria bacterium]|nr:PocR ligand-binding domain-containing protein [Alphaproteobacteria bacterium]